MFGKLVAVALPFLVISLTTLGAITYTRGRDGLEDAAAAEVESSARQTGTAIELWVSERRDDIARIAEDPVTAPLIRAALGTEAAAPSPEDAAALRRTWASTHQPFTEVFLLDPRTGEVLVSTNPESVGRRRDDQAYFLDGRRQPTVWGPYFSLQSHEPAMTAAAPVAGLDGQTIAVVAGHIDLEPLHQITGPPLTPQGSDESFVITRTGLFATPPRLIEDPAQLPLGIRTAEVDACRRQETSRLRYDDYRGVEVIGAVRYVAALDACVVAKTDVSQAFGPVRDLRGDVQLFILGAMVAGIVATLLTARALVRPLRLLQAGVARFGQGDLDARVEVRSNDEVAQVAAEFNRMAGTISATTRELNDRQRELEAVNADFSETNSQLEAFTYTIAHDLRAPLRAMTGFGRILADEHGGAFSDDGLHCLARIQHNASAMTALVDDLLAFSRLNREPMRPESLDMEQLVRSAIDHVCPPTSPPRIDFAVGHLPPAVADRRLMTIVLDNLLDNAVKFANGQEHPRIEISATDSEGGTTYTVRDNGVGYDPRYQDKLFEVFQRLHPTEGYEGTGIGLATVQRIVTRHGGRVWSEGGVGQGAAFHFTVGERAP